MSIQQASTVLFDSAFSAWLYARAINLEIISGIMIALLIVVLLYKGLTNWRNKAVHRALDAEFERQRQAQNQANIAEGNKRYGLQLALRSVWDEVNSLYYALHGTTQQLDTILAQVCGKPMPMVLPESHRPFLDELTAIMRGLTLLGTQLDDARVEREDLDMYSTWVQELWGCYLLFDLQENNEQRQLQGTLSELRELYEEIGQMYWMAPCDRVYQRFSGMLHIVELLEDDQISAASYIETLSKQIAKLAVRFEKEI